MEKSEALFLTLYVNILLPFLFFLKSFPLICIQCNNLYVAGKFSHAGGILSGPIAFYNQTTGQWQSVGQQNLLTWSGSLYVNDVTVDCSMDNSGICLTCDVWLGGNFIVYISGQSLPAINILHWDSVNSKWDPVSGNPELVLGEVLAITKKDYGNSFASNNVWVAGSFKSVFTRYNIGSQTWGFSPPLGGYFQGVIYSLYYKVCLVSICAFVVPFSNGIYFFFSLYVYRASFIMKLIRFFLLAHSVLYYLQPQLQP